eukprot:7441572-Ditylum_brightwellii.AAC.1
MCNTRRSKQVKVNISSEAFMKHIGTLSSLKWNAFAIPAFKDVIATIKAKVKQLCSLLHYKLDTLSMAAAARQGN